MLTGSSTKTPAENRPKPHRNAEAATIATPESIPSGTASATDGTGRRSRCDDIAIATAVDPTGVEQAQYMVDQDDDSVATTAAASADAEDDANRVVPVLCDHEAAGVALQREGSFMLGRTQVKRLNARPGKINPRPAT